MRSALHIPTWLMILCGVAGQGINVDAADREPFSIRDGVIDGSQIESPRWIWLGSSPELGLSHWLQHLFADPPPDIRTITGRVKVSVDNESWSTVEVEAGKKSFHTSWLNRVKSPLQSGEVYTFVVYFSRTFAPSIEKILAGDRLLFDATVCEVHGVKMTRKRLELRHGDYGSVDLFPSISVPQPSYKVAAAVFPNYRKVMFGGCVSYGHSHDWTFMCPSCETAFEAWLRSQFVGNGENTTASTNKQE